MEPNEQIGKGKKLHKIEIIVGVLILLVIGLVFWYANQNKNTTVPDGTDDTTQASPTVPLEVRRANIMKMVDEAGTRPLTGKEKFMLYSLIQGTSGREYNFTPEERKAITDALNAQ